MAISSSGRVCLALFSYGSSTRTIKLMTRRSKSSWGRSFKSLIISKLQVPCKFCSQGMDIQAKRLEKRSRLCYQSWHVLIQVKVRGGYSTSCILMKKSIKIVSRLFLEETLPRNFWIKSQPSTRRSPSKFLKAKRFSSTWKSCQKNNQIRIPTIKWTCHKHCRGFKSRILWCRSKRTSQSNCHRKTTTKITCLGLWWARCNLLLNIVKRIQTLRISLNIQGSRSWKTRKMTKTKMEESLQALKRLNFLHTKRIQSCSPASNPKWPSCTRRRSPKRSELLVLMVRITTSCSNVTSTETSERSRDSSTSLCCATECLIMTQKQDKEIWDLEHTQSSPWAETLVL